MADALAQIDSEIEFLTRSIQEQKNAQAQLASMQGALHRLLNSLGPNAHSTPTYTPSQQQFSCPSGGPGVSTINSGSGGQCASWYGPSSEGTSGSTLAEARFNIRPPNSSYGTGSGSSGQQSTLAQCRFNIVSTDGSSSGATGSSSNNHPGNSYFSGNPSSGTGTSGSTYAAFHHLINPVEASGQCSGGSSRGGGGMGTYNSSGQTCSSGSTIEQYRYFINPDGSAFTSSNPYSTQGSTGSQCPLCNQYVQAQAQRMGCPSNRNMISLPLQPPPHPFQPQPQNFFRRSI